MHTSRPRRFSSSARSSCSRREINTSALEKNRMVSKPPISSFPLCMQRALWLENASLARTRSLRNRREAAWGTVDTRAKITNSLTLTVIKAATQNTV